MNKNDKLNSATPSENKNDTIELNDDNLESVAGGIRLPQPKININPSPIPSVSLYKKCPSCGKNMILGECSSCGYRE